jgi:autonomous glycyl radical cofactor GrcA
MNNISVVAGHFSWGVWNQLPVIKSSTLSDEILAPLRHPSITINVSATSVSANSQSILTATSSSGQSPPPCFIMGRHPVERAISYYYQRCYQISGCTWGYQQRLNSMNPELVRQFIIADRQGEARIRDDPTDPIFVLDEGMSDAACRAVGNFKKTSGMVFGVDDISIPEALTAEEVRTSLSNAAQCVVGLQERWKETKEVIKVWFPWMDLSLGDSERRRMHLYDGKETIETLREDIRWVIEEENACDILLHKQMTAQFEKQLEVIQQSKAAFAF